MAFGAICHFSIKRTHDKFNFEKPKLFGCGNKVLRGFDGKTAQIIQILYDFCRSRREKRRILCNFAVAFCKECKDIMLNRLSITT